MANVNVNFNARTLEQVHAPRFGPGLNFYTSSNQPIDPALIVAAPLGGSTGTQQTWQARLVLGPNDGTITRIIIGVSFPSGVYEIAYINGAPTPDYSGKTTVAETSPGDFAITLIRNGGWPSSPRVFVHADTDRGGMTR